MYAHGRHVRRTAALSLLATALPSSALIGGRILSPALAAPAGSSTFGSLQKHLSTHGVARRRLFSRGDRSAMNSNVLRSMSAARGGDAAASPFSRPVKNVVVVGGTHGNEYTGVWCIKAIEVQRDKYNDRNADAKINDNDKNESDEKVNGGNGVVNVFERFPTLQIKTLLANPVAFANNRRFVGADLNRQFSREELRRATIDQKAMEECDVTTEFCSDENADGAASLPHEAVRAREIDSILGPKFDDDGVGLHPSPAVDMVVDLHTTTTNMGTSLIVPEGDAVVAAAAAHVARDCRRRYGEDGAPRILMHAIPDRGGRKTLGSCARHGFTIEVGPVPQGVLRHDAVEKTQAAMHSLMEFLHLRNLELEDAAASDGGDDDDAVAPSVLDDLRRAYPDGAVPCYRSAPAVRPGELSGKIPWPTDASNPNFPLFMVHDSLQDQDFCVLRRGDPLFVKPDGTVVPYDGSHGEEVRPIFVNEGGYYYESSGTGIGVAVEGRYDWRTGRFLAESDDEGSPVEEVFVGERDS